MPAILILSTVPLLPWPKIRPSLSISRLWLEMPMLNRKIIISDPTLRDGNHAVKHELNIEQIAAYCKAADAAGVSIVEVGHGNGLGASSLQLGESKTPDHIALATARANLKTSQL